MRFLIVVLLLLGTQNNIFSQGVEKVADQEVNETSQQVAQDFATSFLNTIKQGETYDLKDNAIPQMKQQFTEEAQKQIYSQLNQVFGDFESLNFSEAYNVKDQPYTIYRYKSDFTKIDQEAEVRIVLNEENKIAGFFVVPWKDELQ